MDIIIGGLTALAASLLLILGPKLKLAFLAPLKPEKRQTASKLLVGFLAGLITFTLFTDKVPTFPQRLSIIFFSVLLIGANLFLTLPSEEEKAE